MNKLSNTNKDIIKVNENLTEVRNVEEIVAAADCLSFITDDLHSKLETFYT